MQTHLLALNVEMFLEKRQLLRPMDIGVSMSVNFTDDSRALGYAWYAMSGLYVRCVVPNTITTNETRSTNW